MHLFMSFLSRVPLDPLVWDLLLVPWGYLPSGQVFGSYGSVLKSGLICFFFQINKLVDMIAYDLLVCICSLILNNFFLQKRSCVSSGTIDSEHEYSDFFTCPISSFFLHSSFFIYFPKSERKNVKEYNNEYFKVEKIRHLASFLSWRENQCTGRILPPQHLRLLRITQNGMLLGFKFQV